MLELANYATIHHLMISCQSSLISTKKQCNFTIKNHPLKVLAFSSNANQRIKLRNNNGYKLVDICKDNNLTILNGRYGKDRNIGNATFRGKSVIDYTISSIKGFTLLTDFEIIESDSLLSDGHSIIAFSIGIPSRVEPTSPVISNRKATWRQTESHLFVENINRDHIQEITQLLNRFKEAPSQTLMLIYSTKNT